MMKKVHPEFQATWIDCACNDKAHSICVEAILEEDDEMLQSFYKMELSWL